MGQTVTFTPSTINCGVAQPGSTAVGLSQCAPITAPVNVTAEITADTSGGAITLVSVTSWLIEIEIQQPDPGLPPGPPPKPVPVKVPVQKGQSNGVTPLAVAAGEYVEVTVQFAPTPSTPDVCAATLQISGDTWNPVSLPITAAVGELKVSVSPITVKQGASTSVAIEVTSVAGGNTTVNLNLQADASPEAANVTASVSPSSFPIGSGQSVFATLSVSAASDLPTGPYVWDLGVWAFDNAYSFSVPVTINVGAPYYFIKSKLGNVIDVGGASTEAGALLDAWPQKSSGTDNQLWEFVTDPAGSGYCFIKSRLNASVIDVQGASTNAGALLDAYPWKLTNYDNQLWTVVDGSFPSVVGTVPPGRDQGKQLNSGYYNYVLANGSSCATLTGVKVTIYFTEDLVWESSSQPNHPGFSIQLNAETNSSQPLDWLQFVVHMGNDQGLWPWINIFKPGKGGPGDPTTLWIQSVANPVAEMPQSARIPAGYSIVIALQNDSGRVTGATWSVLDSSGTPVVSGSPPLTNPVSYPLSNAAPGGGVPPADLSQIASFQVIFGGALDGAYATFSSGAGVIIYEADQAMTVDWWPSCIGYTGGTGESSNVGYSVLEAMPSTLFSQAFGVLQDSAQMRQINPNARKLPVPKVKP
jgi:hypothetical protein